MSRARGRAVAKTATAPTLVAGDATEGGPEGRLGALEQVAVMRRTPAMRWAPSPLRRFFGGLPPEMDVRLRCARLHPVKRLPRGPEPFGQLDIAVDDEEIGHVTSRRRETQGTRVYPRRVAC